MTLIAYLTIRNRRLGRSGWYRFRHYPSSGALVHALQRVYGSKVSVKTVLTEG